MCSGVRTSEDDVGVVPQLTPQRPIVVAVISRRRPQDRGERVGDGDLAQAGEGIHAPLRRDVPDGATLERGVRDIAGVTDVVGRKVSQPGERRPLGLGEHLLANRRVAQRGCFLVERQRQDVPPARNEPQGAERAEAHVHLGVHRHHEGDHPATDLARPLRRKQLVQGFVPMAPRHRQNIPVHGPVRRRADAGEQVGLLLGEAPQAPLDDPLQRRALVLADGAAERQQLVLRSQATGNGTLVSVHVRRRSGCGEPEAPCGDRVMEHRDHLGDLGFRGLPLDCVRAHHVPAQCAVPHEETRIHTDASIQPVEVVAKGLPVPRRTLLERRDRHSLHARHHAADVVAVLRPERRQSETAVPPEDRRHAMGVRRRCVWIPVQLCVVVRMDIDDARSHDKPAGVKGLRRFATETLAGSRAIRPRHDLHDAPVLDPDVGSHGLRTRAVDDGPPGNRVVEHQTSMRRVRAQQRSGSPYLTIVSRRLGATATQISGHRSGKPRSRVPCSVPPSTSRIFPVTNDAAGDARNNTAQAISLGSPIRRRGVTASMAVRMASSRTTMSRADVAADPTATAFTRIRGAKSRAARRVQCASAAFAVP